MKCIQICDKGTSNNQKKSDIILWNFYCNAKAALQSQMSIHPSIIHYAWVKSC